MLRYVRGFLYSAPQLQRLIVCETRETIELSNGVCIEIHTASRIATRSYTLGACVNDEISFWPTSDDAAQPDKEIIAAQRPSLSTIPGALMLNISSPYAVAASCSRRTRSTTGAAIRLNSSGKRRLGRCRSTPHPSK